MYRGVILLAALVGIALGIPQPPVSFPEGTGILNHVLAGTWNADLTDTDGTFDTIIKEGFMGSTKAVSVTGRLQKTVKGSDVYSFLGMLYGENPSDDKRFKRVEMLDQLIGFEWLTADVYGSKCPQMNGDIYDADSNENCLSLNVYTNKLPNQTTTGTIPVMVFIHGGSFVSGNASLYKPDVLLDHDVILVTIQYRLGSLGFFTELNKESPGNAGLWDQIVALQWVQKNIGFLGGDKNKVTIFGEGVGAASVNYLLLFKNITTVTGKLFRAAIIESGSALDYWALDADPITSAAEIAKLNGCNNASKYTSCMQTVSVQNLTTNLQTFITTERNKGRLGFKGISPVVQDNPPIPVKERLLLKHPEILLKDNNNLVDVPVIIGANKHEGSYSFGVIYWSLPISKYTDTEFLRNEMLARILESTGVPAPAYDLAQVLEADYIGGRDLANLTAASPGLIDLTGALYIKDNAWRLAQSLASLIGRKNYTYFYSFDFESENSLFDTYFPNPTPNRTFEPGVCHGDEMMYLFNIPAGVSFNAMENKTRDRLATLWTNFAIFLEPTPNATNVSWLALDIPKWKQMRKGETNYLLIEESLTTPTDYYQRRHVALEETEPVVPTPKPGPSQDDYDHIDHQRTAFMACMIVFLILMVAFGGLSGFLYYKHK